jgi:DNA-binding CsgD family transcriptional regulator
MLERDDQLVRLQRWFEQASLGFGHLVFIGGEAGAGKSLLVQTFTDSIAARAQVLIGWCDPVSPPRPAGPLVDMARGFGDPVSSVLRQENRPGLFDAVYADLAAAQRPTVLIFEDVHWADETTLDLLRFLGRRLGTAPALVLATYRDDETGRDHPLRSRLGDLATQSAVSRIALPPLSLDAVTTLAGQSTVDASRVWAKTGGNAFFVTEVLQAGADEVPATVADAVLARIGRLSSTARHALTAAAVLGPRAERFALLDVVGGDTPAIDECVDAGLLQLSSPVFTFRHELVRQAVLSGIGEADRRRLNAQVLDALRSHRVDQDLLARLAELAENADDRAAVIEFAPAAGLRAAHLGSHREAATQYDRALRFTTSEAERAELLQRLAEECYLTGDLLSAVESGEQALQLRRVLGQQEQAGAALRWLSRFYWYSGNRAAGERCAAESLDILTPLGPSSELAMAMSSQSQLLMLGGEHEPAIRWGIRAIALATELDLPDVVAHAMNNVGTSESSLGIPEGLQRLRKSLQLSLELGAEDHASRAYANLSHHLVALRHLDDAGRVLDEGLAYCAARDLDVQIPYLRATRALMNVRRGHWTAALNEANDVLALPGATPVHRFAALLPAVMVSIRTGSSDGAMIPELGRVAHDLGEIQRLAAYANVRAEALWLAGQHVTADAELSAIYGRTTSSGERAAATELAWWLGRAGLTVDPPSIRHGAFRDALADPRSAAADLELLGSQYDAALCLMEGNEEDLRQALEIFNRLGAKPAAAAAQATLRRLGARKIPRGPRPTTRRDPHGLTARQLEVLDLMAEHLTNAEIARRLFLSERTVDHHVSAILSKLHVQTRDDAIRHA